MRHDDFIPNVTIKSRGRLPHWQVDHAVYFITFRLRDSLPREVARELYLERERLIESAGDRANVDRAFGIRLDTALDTSFGSCLLREHAGLVSGALKHFDGCRYSLHAWCVMPNHVHVLVQVAQAADVPVILHSWKSFTAHAIGQGPIWQREYFDRIVRSPAEFMETRAYIRANPFKAGLKDWKWVG